MQGKVVLYSNETKTGILQGPVDLLYSFSITDVKTYLYLEVGDEVSFDKEPTLQGFKAVNIVVVKDTQEMQDDCEHEFDMSEGGCCLNCGSEEWYNHFDEDYGQER